MTAVKKQDDPVAQAARRWWRALQPDEKTWRGGDRGALARLRRCTAPEDAATIPAALALARAFGIADAGDTRLPSALATAIVLTHLRHNDRATHPARGLAGTVSPLRFSRLLQAETAEERITAFRRAIALADRPLDVGRLARAVFDWPGQRVAWAFEFHGTEPPSLPETNEDAPA